MESGIPQRKFLRESRALDYVYDNVYTTSSGKDFLNAAAMGSRATSEIKLRPIYKSMFSVLKTDRRLELCLVDKQPCLLQNFLPSYNAETQTDKNSGFVRNFEPTGADRALFALQYSSDIDYKSARPVAPYDMEEEIIRVKKAATHSGSVHVTRGQQSDYRESETQTDPYSPPYTLPYEGAYPRVLALINLTWGKGLPPTLDYIASIEKALARRISEMAKHNVDDEEEFMEQSKVMEELEAHLWAEREKELKAIMIQKSEIMKRMRHDLQVKIGNMDSLKLEKVFDSEKKKNTIVLGHIRHKYLRELRKLEKKFCKKEVGSRVEAILAENGYGLDRFIPPAITYRKLRHIPQYDSQITNDFQVFDNLTTSESFKKNRLEWNCQEFTKCVMGTRPSNRDRRSERMLDDAFHSFRAETLKKSDPAAEKMIARKLKNQIRRMPTPTVEGPPPEEEMATNAVVLLQKVIRGRAVQTMMREEIRANASTLADMKALHEMDPSGSKATFGEIATIRMMQTEREATTEREIEISEVLDQLEGETLGQQLDFLDKEMVRLQDERKIHSLLMLAERERRMKEATEAGRRQKEEDDRRVNDEIFRQVVGIHQSTVDMYLEDIYLNNLERTADDNARAHVQNLASILNQTSYLSKTDVIDEDVEEMTADIVHSFLMPEMNRIYQRQRIETLNDRYLRASNEVVRSACTAQGVVREIIDLMGPTMATHLSIGEAAVDGAQLAVDGIIKLAVAKSFLPIPDPCQPTEIREEDAEEVASIQGEDAEPTLAFEPIQLEVPCLKAELGLKSIELTTGTEIGVDAVNLVLAAKHVTCSFFEEAKELVKSYATNADEDEGQDEELESEDDVEL